MKRRIVLSYGEDEYLPLFTSIGHNLKEKNLFFLESKTIMQNGDYIVVISDLYKDESDEKKRDKIFIYSFYG